ncbi:MAG: hypothetical protein V1708_06230 [Candidatus Micrarchaeota archaeon]
MKTYLFEVRFRKHPDVTRTIEVRADQSLAALHGAIQESIGWRNDHLYSFFFKPRPEDWVYMRKALEKNCAGLTEFEPMPEGKIKRLVDAELSGAKMEYACPFELEPPRKSSGTRLSSLGLTLGLKFEYLFDYGDNHWFDVQVQQERQVKGGMKYPRVLARNGRAPEQYPPCK